MIDVFNFLKKSVRLELVYTDISGVQSSFESEIKEIFDDKILVAYPKSKTINFDKVETFARLNVIIYTEDGVLSSNANVLKKEHGEAKDVFISFPYNNQFCQRREDTRIPMHVDFELNISDGENIIEMYALKSKNISGKGLACITAEPLSDFESGEVTIHLNATDIQALCRKVYSKELILNDSCLYINGLAFTDIKQEDINLIVKECLKFQLESKRNEKLFETL